MGSARTTRPHWVQLTSVRRRGARFPVVAAFGLVFGAAPPLMERPPRPSGGVATAPAAASSTANERGSEREGGFELRRGVGKHVGAAAVLVLLSMTRKLLFEALTCRAERWEPSAAAAEGGEPASRGDAARAPFRDDKTSKLQK